MHCEATMSWYRTAWSSDLGAPGFVVPVDDGDGDDGGGGGGGGSGCFIEALNE